MAHSQPDRADERDDSAYAGGGTGPGTGGRYDDKRDPPFPESAPIYQGHAASDFDSSRNGSVEVTDSGVSNADVDEFTTGGNSLGNNVGAARGRRTHDSDKN